MKRILKRISSVCVAVIMVILTITTSFAATVYYYFGYMYTNINNDMVSLYGIDDNGMDTLFVPDTLNNKKLVDIRNNAFKDNTQIRLLEFAGATNLERIGSFAFSGCTTLTGNITFPLNIKTIETAAFEGCTSIDSIVYNASCEYIPNQCFKGCTNLSSVILNDKITRIGYYAFDGCKSLKYIEISTTVTDIANSAFQNIDDIILGVYKDSYALQFAEDNKIDHIILDGDKTGDVNGDGVVDILDATEIQKYAAESTEFTTEQFELGDINKDGYCDVIDALLVQKSVIGAYELPQNIIRY